MLGNVPASVLCYVIAGQDYRASVTERPRAPARSSEEPVMHDHPLIRKLESYGLRLTDEEVAAVLGMPMQVESIRADQDIVREGDRPTRSCLILEGYVA